MKWKAYLWVPKELYEEVNNIEARLNRAKNEVVDIARSRYMDKWLWHFRDAKTKKEIWRRLTDNGKRYPSLSSFYAHTRNKDLETYLRQEFCYDNLPAILEKLDTVDNELSQRIETVREIERELRTVKEQLKKEGYK